MSRAPEGAEREEREALDAAARAGIRRLTIPTPFQVGAVNAYLIEDSPLTLVDAGPRSEDSLEELERSLAELGHAIEDLELIVITHQHLDHFGLAATLARRSRAEVAALDSLAPYLGSYPEQAELDETFAERVMRRNGVPADAIEALRRLAVSLHRLGEPVAVDRPLGDGGELNLSGRSLRVLHRPGHSPSDTVLLDESSSILIAGDHLLARISSNALLARALEPAPAAGTGGRTASEDRPRPLLSYIASLQATREMDLSLLLPGHGAPVSDHVALIDERLRLHGRRAAKIHRLISERPLSGYEIACLMWRNVAVSQAYLTLSEALGHADLLVRDGRAREVERDGTIAFTATEII